MKERQRQRQVPAAEREKPGQAEQPTGATNPKDGPRTVF
jgi:hypothetical protein